MLCAYRVGLRIQHLFFTPLSDKCDLLLFFFYICGKTRCQPAYYQDVLTVRILIIISKKMLLDFKLYDCTCTSLKKKPLLRIMS